METWKLVPGFASYQVSDLGRVKSSARGKPRILKTKPTKRGQLQVHLGRKACRYVHRLVLEAFVGPCPEGMQGCHEDDVPSNNILTNLRWDTQLGNMADKIRNGKQQRGQGHCNAVLLDAQVKKAKQWLRDGRKQKDIADELGVDASLISHIKSGRRWAHITWSAS